MILLPPLMLVPQSVGFFLKVAPAHSSGDGDKTFLVQFLVHLPHQLVGVGLLRVAPRTSCDRFWLDEDTPGAIRLFQLVRNPGKYNLLDDTDVRYNDSGDWPAHAPVGIYFHYGLVDEFMRKWLLRQQELHAGEVIREEYFEWKLNWPYTCDDCRKCAPKIQWRTGEANL